ncbi:hypothetical protein H2198_010548 [Neophaeococcomyces mojaviensis]|uniref:Uncharacterized protein n=1 Tax=Neophaeococcomyces mojaviensis TaxID=3383035 RepID=A0ACC2ZR89_9EURO|nr:hypothetical protein H2198_010548 [Knufia sp. JES_112]
MVSNPVNGSSINTELLYRTQAITITQAGTIPSDLARSSLFYRGPHHSSTEIREWIHDDNSWQHKILDINAVNTAATSIPSPKWITFDPFSTRSYRLASIRTEQSHRADITITDTTLPANDATETPSNSTCSLSPASEPTSATLASTTSISSSTSEISPKHPLPHPTSCMHQHHTTHPLSRPINPQPSAIELYNVPSIQELVDDKAIDIYNRRATIHNILVRLYGEAFHDPRSVMLPTLEEVFAELRYEGWNLEGEVWGWD